MSIGFRTGQYIDPSGFPLAVVNVPALDPNTNISLNDNSYLWEENITSTDSSVIQSYVSNSGLMPPVLTTDFLVTNIVSNVSNDTNPVPLYYKHVCRFYHYTYGNNPISQVRVTDSAGNALSNLPYTVQVTRKAKYVYQVNVLTSFRNPTGSSYKIQYNRCDSTGNNIYPNWTETLSVTPLFVVGVPTAAIDQYLATGPFTNGSYNVIVPSVPTITGIINTLGVSIANAPTVIINSIANNVVSYMQGVITTYTITAISSNTFTIKRDYDPATGILVNNYLSSISSNTWGSAAVFTAGTIVTGVPGVSIFIHTDNVLVPNDQASFQATTSYYYLTLTSYEAIHLAKPLGYLPSDDWYMSVSNGSFVRNMDASGNEVPPGYGTAWRYSIPEYVNQAFDLNFGAPYAQSVKERPTLQSQYVVLLENTPLYIDPASVFSNPTNPGFPPYDYISVEINGNIIPQTSIIDWDVDNGIITLGEIVSNRDNLLINYAYHQDNYVYQGFSGSGWIYPTSSPFPFEELNLNPTPGLGWDIYASGMIATVYAKPYYNATASGVVNSPVLYHTFTGNSQTDMITDPNTWYFDHFTGSNGATTHTSDSGQVLTFISGATIDSSTSFFGGTSLKFNGTTGYVTVPYRAGNPLMFASNDFTIELRFSFNSLTNQQEIMGQYVDSNNNWNLSKSTNASGNKLSMYFISGGVVVANYTMASSWSGVTTSQWNTLMFGVSNGVGIISINGNPQTLTATVPWGNNNMPSLNTTLNLGYNHAHYSNGWMDEVIINTNFAIYPSAYTPTTTPYRYGQVDFNIGSVSLGLNCAITDVNIIDVRSRAGGLNSDGIANLPTVETLQPESQFYWDVGYFDGQAVPADGVLVVTVPSSVLVANGGPFTEDEVKSRIYKHVALGMFVIIQYE